MERLMWTGGNHTAEMLRQICRLVKSEKDKYVLSRKRKEETVVAG